MKIFHTPDMAHLFSFFFFHCISMVSEPSAPADGYNKQISKIQ